jgi:ABC-type sugar transport system ATPase subunit
MSEVRLIDLTKCFGDFQAVKKVSMRFLPHTTTCLLGPSGCGKTTILRMIAGLEAPTSGQIWIGGHDVTASPPRRRDIAMVFQYPTIYRGLGVYENIELPLREQKLSVAERRKRVENAIELLELTESLKKDPNRFDNGTRQRVAFARAVARQSAILLFDEPITNVDPESKFRLKQDLKKLTQELKQTIVYVTHDQNEAMTLADQIVLMKDGSVLQQNAPRQVYNHPSHRFGGWFLGNPGMSFLDHPIPPSGAGLLRSDLFPYLVRLSGELPNDARLSHKVVLGVRPEQVQLRLDPDVDAVPCEVLRKFLGVAGQYLVAVRLREHTVWVKCSNQLGRKLGRQAHLRCSPGVVTVFDDNERALAVRLVRHEEVIKPSPEAMGI